MLPRQVRGVRGSDETGSLQLIIEANLSPPHGESLGESEFRAEARHSGPNEF